MLGLLASLIIFNFIAFRFTSRLSLNEKIHIWLFSICLQALFDLFVDAKMGAYWYFTRDIDWASLPIILFLVPPVNLCVLSWYPYGRTIPRQLVYILCVYIFQIVYELLTLMPEPIGYFHYGWWEIWYSMLVNPLLLFALFSFYNWIRRIERKRVSGH